jgi:dTDP-4-amino-4,6-dideoxygalactose transaminase
MADVVALAREWGLVLVEDAAQAHGARDEAGRAAGSFGDAGCFSFHPSKNLGAFGDGGLVALSDDALERELRARRDLGKVGKHEVRYASLNSKLDTLQAALLHLKLPGLDAANERRRAHAARYRAALAGLGDLALPDDPGGGGHVFHLFVVRTAARDALRDHLERRGIRAGLHYPIPPHLQDLRDARLGYGPGDFPVAEECARTVLSLPVAPELDEAEIERVAAAVRAFFGEAAA